MNKTVKPSGRGIINSDLPTVNFILMLSEPQLFLLFGHTVLYSFTFVNNACTNPNIFFFNSVKLMF